MHHALVPADMTDLRRSSSSVPCLILLFFSSEYSSDPISENESSHDDGNDASALDHVTTHENSTDGFSSLLLNTRGVDAALQACILCASSAEDGLHFSSLMRYLIFPSVFTLQGSRPL